VEFNLNDQYQLLLSAKTSEELEAGLIAAARALEFDNFAYGLRVDYRVSKPRVELMNNYSSIWQENYEKNEYIKKDPTVLHGMQTTVPILWSKDKFSGSLDLWEDARDHGLVHGWAQSTFGPSCASGLLTLARSGQEITELELQEKQGALAFLSQVAYQGMESIILPDLVPKLKKPLSPREREVLAWASEGKTSFEAGKILGIAERTANYHLNNSMDKLGVFKKTAAVVRAVKLGVI
jgi:LuxR family transcriptional regulator